VPVEEAAMCKEAPLPEALMKTRVHEGLPEAAEAGMHHSAAAEPAHRSVKRTHAAVEASHASVEASETHAGLDRRRGDHCS
jgi:hypothetical protein